MITTIFHTFTKKFFSILMVITFLFISGCGGGFDGDSDNAKQFKQSIFGTDTLE